MTTLDDVVTWVWSDILSRTDTALQTTIRKHALSVYKIICAKVPFDELMITSPELPLTQGLDTYVLGTDMVFIPELRAISNIRITFDPSNKRRLRRSHARTFDALSISPATLPATYARFDTNIQLNPPPNSSAYTLRFRYWSRPTIGVLQPVTTATWGGASAVLTVPSVIGFTPGDPIVVKGIRPSGYNGNFVVSAVGTNTVTYALANNPGAYVVGGTVNDLANYWTTQMVTPEEWDELFKWETLYRTYYSIEQPEMAMALMQPAMLPRQQGSPRKQNVFETGIIPRLWNDLLATASSQEGVDEDFSINPTIRPYSLSV